MSFWLISCEKRDAVTNTHNQREGLQVYTNPELTRQFKEGLEREGVPFSTSIREGLEYIHWAPEHDSRVTTVKNRLFGEQPPIDRSICMDKTQIAELKKWLKQEGIPFKVAVYYKQECVVWSKEDHMKVERTNLIPIDQKSWLFYGAG